MAPDLIVSLGGLGLTTLSGAVLVGYGWLTYRPTRPPPPQSLRRAAHPASHFVPNTVASPTTLDVAALAQALAAQHELPPVTAEALVRDTLAALVEAGVGDREVAIATVGRFRAAAP